MHLDDARLFAAIAASESLSEAARRLSRSPASVSAGLQRLEALTEVQLVRRSTRTMALTAEGRDFLQTCAALLEVWDRGEQRLRDAREEVVGAVRVAAPVDLAQQRIGDLVATFVEAFPSVHVTLLVDDAFAALPGEDVDVALRYGRLDDSALVGVGLGVWPRLVVAAPSLVERVGPLSEPRELEAHPTLAWIARGRPLTRWDLTRGRRRASAETRPRLCGDGALVRRWALDGHGFAFKSELDVADDLAAGTLVDALPGWTGARTPLTALLPAGRMRAARVEALLRHLRGGLAR